MKRYLLFLILLTAFSSTFFSCKTKNEASDPKVILEKLKPKAQVFTVGAESISTITGESGIQITVIPASLEKVNGDPIGTSIEVELIEMISKKDLVLNNAQTVSNGKLLISGGAYDINMKSDGVALRIKKDRTLPLALPILDTNDMSFFTGEYDKNGQMDWVLKEPLMAPDICELCEGYCQWNRISEGCLTDFYYHKSSPNTCLYCHEDIEEKKLDLKEWNTKWKKNWELDFIEVSDDVFKRLQTEIEFDLLAKNSAIYNTVQLTSLGLINCDRFLDDDIPLFNLKVRIENDNIQSGKVYAVFHKIQSVMSEPFVPASLDKLNFRNIPENYDLTIIAVSDVDGEAFYGEKKLNTSTAKEVSIKLNKSSLEAINKKLDALN